MSMNDEIPATAKALCAVCGHTFIRPVGRGRPQLYCSDPCKRLAATRLKQGKPIR